MLEPTDEDVTKGGKKFNNDGLHNLFLSASIITFIKSRKGWVGRVA